ncbi:CZB domain-containing protein [Campylobacter sp. 19-13652]|uniref:CZB domain-containing protein n=1 Tax=Campylobacter sp. 19-13652 TaxID=2840180 RepID=UPI0021A29CA4
MIDHIVFKQTGYSKLLNQDFTPLSDHFNCRLGKWLASTGKEAFGATHTFKQIDAPHSAVHTIINGVLTGASESFSQEYVNGAIKKFEVAEGESMKLFSLFDKMLSERIEAIKKK